MTRSDNKIESGAQSATLSIFPAADRKKEKNGVPMIGWESGARGADGKIHTINFFP